MLRRAVCLGALCGLLCLAACGESGSEGSEQEEPDDEPTACTSDFDCDFGQFCVDEFCSDPGSECDIDDDCAGDLVCRRGFCLEDEGVCAEDGDCGEGEICQEQRCRVGCREDGQCPEGRVCDPGSLVCIEPPEDCGGMCPEHTECNQNNGECEPDGTCTDEDDCLDDQRCDAGVCVDLGDACERNDDCDDGQFCNRDEGRCVPGCRQANECRIEEVCVAGQCTDPPPCDDDMLEPNNNDDEATALGPVQSFEGLTFCEDDDWFTFTAFAGDDVEISTAFIHDDGNLNMQLYDPLGELLQLAATPNDGETLQRTIDETGAYTVRVFGAGRGVFTQYDFNIEITRNCSDDDSEENDTLANATVVDPLAEALTERFVCGADEDWYAIELFPGEELEVALRFEHALGDLSLELYDAEETLLDSAQSEDDDEVLTYSAAQATEIFVRVPGQEGLVNRYAVEATVVVPDCEDDGLEDNDSPEEAGALVAGQGQAGQICAGDEDWYAVALPADVEVTFSLEHTHAQGDLTLAVWAEGQEMPLAISATDADTEAVTFTPELPGQFFVQVVGRGRAQGAYTLLYEGGPTSVCPDNDRFEDNDAFETPALLEAGVEADLILCGEEEDWYSFELAEGQSAEVFVLGLAQQGAVNAALFGPNAVDDNERPVDEVLGLDAVKRVRVQTGTPAGTYRLRISPRQGEGVLYSLRVNIYDGALPLGCEFDDEFEDNNVVSDAARLSAAQTYDAILCGEDVDWYRFDAQAGQVLSIRADFLHEDGDLNMVLHGGMPLAPLVDSETETDGEFIRYTAMADGPVFVEVMSAAQVPEGAIYALTISTVDGPVAQSCITDDVYEQNDNVDEATLVEDRVVSAIHCTQDDDYFAVPLLSGQTLQAELLYRSEESLSLAVVDSNDVQVAVAEEVEISARFVEHVADADGTVSLAVLSEVPVDAPYTLRYAVLDAPLAACDPFDAQEPDNNPVEATEVLESTTFDSLTMCGDDADWYRVMVPAGQALIATADFDPALGNIELVAFDQEGGGLGSSSSTTGRERLELASDRATQEIFLKVFQAEGTDETQIYSLDLAFAEVSSCAPDEFEDNNTQGTARRLSPGLREGLSICAADEDWFAVDVNLLQTITARVTFDGDAADLDVELYDGFTQTLVAVSNGLGGVEEVAALAIFPATYFVRVYGFDDETISDYDLQIFLQ